MTILILDNGRNCSDHIVFFLEGTAEQAARIKEACDEGLFPDGAHVVLVAEQVEWHQGEKAPMEDVFAVVGWECPESGFYQDPDNTYCFCCPDCALGDPGMKRPVL